MVSDSESLSLATSKFAAVANRKSPLPGDGHGSGPECLSPNFATPWGGGQAASGPTVVGKSKMQIPTKSNTDAWYRIERQIVQSRSAGKCKR